MCVNVYLGDAWERTVVVVRLSRRSLFASHVSDVIAVKSSRVGQTEIPIARDHKNNKIFRFIRKL